MDEASGDDNRNRYRALNLESFFSKQSKKKDPQVGGRGGQVGEVSRTGSQASIEFVPSRTQVFSVR